MLLIRNIKFHFSETYSSFACHNVATVETNFEKYMPILKKEREPLVFYFNQQVFSPLVYLSSNDSSNSISEMTTIIVEYGILGEKYFDTGYQI